MEEETTSHIKAISTDESLKILGELLGNESSRMIIKALINNEMYAHEIAKKLNLRPNLVAHHLQKMESINLLDITYKSIRKKGLKHKYYSMPAGLLVVPDMQMEDTKNGFAKKIFQKSIKFVMIGIAGVIPLAIQLAGSTNTQNLDHDLDLLSPDSIIMGLAIIIGGLIIERVYTSRKNKKRLR